MQTTLAQECNVCGAVVGAPLFRSTNDRSLTSLCRIHNSRTTVWQCTACGHLKSDPIDDLASYYACDYDILLQSESEDQIYEVRNGRPIYRTEHQLSTLLAKVAIPQKSRLLDFGCAKGSMVRALGACGRDIDLFLFDVSERYISFWRQFATSTHWSIGSVPSEWNETFDVVTSFFALEHVAEPVAVLRSMVQLLKVGGILYCVMPNVLTNVADLIVVDHVNHFNVSSLRRLFSIAGLELIDIDESAHSGALIGVGRRPYVERECDGEASCARLNEVLTQATAIAAYWTTAGDRVRQFEEMVPLTEGIAIYGAGFYGAFIAASMSSPSRVLCHIDQNPHLHGRLFNGKPVVAPSALPSDVQVVFVGLNPIHAKRIIGEITPMSKRHLQYFYL